MRLIRVFPRRTKATPDDELAYVGPPDLYAQADEVHVSVSFTWDKPAAERLAEQWQRVAPVKIGGVAYGDRGLDFVPGRYIKHVYWVISHDGDAHAYRMFHRHYSSDKHPKPKIRQFVGPGEKMVLIGLLFPALFAWRRERFRRDGQQGVNCAVYRNESEHRSSDLIREAMELAWERWPGERLFTMVNPRKVRSTNPGYCFLAAGWRRCGITKSGLVILEAAK